MFIGLNPSTADETKNDKTVSNCIGFNKKWGYGGIYMMNLFAFRATDPMAMIASRDPVGPGNDEELSYCANNVGLIVACWGNVATKYRPRLSWQSRIDRVLNCIQRPVKCFGVTQGGSARHPSRLGYATQLAPYWEPQSGFVNAFHG
jgi:hypothetical protein